MNSGFASLRRMTWRLRLVVAMLAGVGQIGLSGASLTLARDESSALSHAERGGVDLHHGHNEATCAACVALSFHAAPKSSVSPVALVESPLLGHVRASATLVAGLQLLLNSSRAPPRES
jgi:hypothetical protein